MFKTDFSSDNHRLYELYEMYLFYQVYIHLSLFVFVEIEIGRRKFHKKNLHKQCHYLMVATCLFPVHVCLDSIIQAFHVPYNAIFQNRNVRKKKIDS